MAVILINNFSDGWQNKATHGLMSGTALYSCKDVQFDDLGAVRCRDLSVENSFFAGTNETSSIGNIYQVDVEGTGKRLIFYTAGTDLVCWNSATGAATTLSTAMTGGHVSYAALKPLLSPITFVYFTDGTAMGAFNGTTLKTWGIDPPGAIVNRKISLVSGSLTAGAYRYVYTFYDVSTGSESDPSPACAPLTVSASQAIDVSNIEISPSSRVTSRRLYRTTADGGTYYLVTTITDNVTTSYTDTMADASLTVEATMDQGIPPASGDVVLSFSGTIFMSGDDNYPNRVYFCLKDKPDNFPSSYYVEAGSSDDKVLNIAEFDSAVYFAKSAGISRLQGSTPDTYMAVPTRSHIGTAGRWTFKSGPDGIYFLGWDGIYRFDGVKSIRISDAISKIFGKTPTSFYDVVDFDAVGQARADFLGSKYFISLPLKGTDGTTANKIIAYDLLTETWELQNVSVGDLFGDDGRGEIYGALTAARDTRYTVDNLFSSASSSTDTPTPEIITKAFELAEPKEYTITDSGVTQRRSSQDAVGWISKFRLDADGTWVVTFYLDGRSVHSETIVSSSSTRHLWRRLPSKCKGVYLWVKLTASGVARPDGYVIRSLEVR